MALSDWDAVASNNTNIDGVNIAENCPPGGINNAIRSIMAAVRSGISDYWLGVLDESDAAAARTAMGVPQGTAALTSISGLTPAANRLPYYTSASAAALTTLTSFARSLLDDADAASARATLGAVGISAVDLNGNGHIKFTHALLPNGFMIQWGSFTPIADSYQTISYSAPFTTFSRAVVSNAAEPGNTNAQANGPGVTACTTTGFTTWTSANSNSQAFWVAVGH